MSAHKESAWRFRQPRMGKFSAALDWLGDRRSLTARLQARGSFSLQVLRQELAPPTRDEALALGLRPGELAWVREVLLFCDGEPLVFAHSVLPRRPRGPMTRWFARLGARSLGALLFAHPGFTRGVLRSRRLDRRDTLFAPAVRALRLQAPAPWPKSLWARRSRFDYGPQSVLVSEIFSPRLTDEPGQRR